MSFEAYITYDEYKELGGTASQDAFPIYERKAQRYLDYLTFDRIKQLTTIPDVVKEVLTDFTNGYADFYKSRNEFGGDDTISQYSNGVETFTYKDKTEDDLRKELRKIALTWLPDYLTFRGVNFDIKRYLQQNSNDTE